MIFFKYFLILIQLINPHARRLFAKIMASAGWRRIDLGVDVTVAFMVNIVKRRAALKTVRIQFLKLLLETTRVLH